MCTIHCGEPFADGYDYHSSGSVSQDGTGDGTIVRNRDYRIKAVIKGDGEPTPGTEVVPSNLELTVSVDDWTLKIVQEVELD